MIGPRMGNVQTGVFLDDLGGYGIKYGDDEWKVSAGVDKSGHIRAAIRRIWRF